MFECGDNRVVFHNCIIRQEERRNQLSNAQSACFLYFLDQPNDKSFYIYETKRSDAMLSMKRS